MLKRVFAALSAALIAGPAIAATSLTEVILDYSLKIDTIQEAELENGIVTGFSGDLAAIPEFGLTKGGMITGQITLLSAKALGVPGASNIDMVLTAASINLGGYGVFTYDYVDVHTIDPVDLTPVSFADGFRQSFDLGPPAGRQEGGFININPNNPAFDAVNPAFATSVEFGEFGTFELQFGLSTCPLAPNLVLGCFFLSEDDFGYSIQGSSGTLVNKNPLPAPIPIPPGGLGLVGGLFGLMLLRRKRGA